MRRAKAGEERIEETVRPGQPAELSPVAITNEALEERAEGGKPVLDEDLDQSRLGRELSGESPCRSRVAFPHVG